MSKILVIDDEESLRFTFECLLAGQGHEVTVAADFDEALAIVSGTEFDLIFSDILLGGRTGIDFLRAYRDKGGTCPVVMITGYPNVESASDAVRLGAFDYIPKPIEPEALLRVTERALRRKKAADEKERYQSRLDAIFRSVGHAIFTVDRESFLTEVNEEAKTLCGFGREDIGKKFGPSLARCEGKCLEALKEPIEKGKSVKGFRIECRRRGKPQQVVYLLAYPLVDRHGTSSGEVMVLRDETRPADPERDPRERRRLHHLVGKSESMQKTYSLIEVLADVDTTVLITGDTGTGKEMVCEALHYLGARRHKPLVKVNCSALSEHLLESELFGHVKGAFTGALGDRVGRFQKADGGTIFLDEIGDVSPKVQQSLLRVLQEKEFERVGDSTPLKVDVRILAATNKDLEEKVKRGEFREDLLYRLKVVVVHLSPLRNRREDIPLLVTHFLEKLNTKLNKKITAVTSDVEKLFMEYSWPGNVRELEHALAHASILCRQDAITTGDLPPQLRAAGGKKEFSSVGQEAVTTETIVRALEKTAWNKAKAARLLGIDRKTLYRKIAIYGIHEETPR